MARVYFHRLIDVQEFDINQDKDIFEQILDFNRENTWDGERFYLSYLPDAILNQYQLNNPESLKEFVYDLSVYRPPFKRIGGCNLVPEQLERGIRYAGIRLSDPEEKIPGQFVRMGEEMTYCPTFPFFTEEYDIVKFAMNTYFTTLTFEEILYNQIQHVTKYFLNKGETKNWRDLKKYGDYIIKKISKSQMMYHATDPEYGNKVLIKSLTYPSQRR